MQTGVEQLVQRIQEEAAALCETIGQQAEDEAAALLEAARIQAEQETQGLREQTQIDADRVRRAARSAAGLTVRNAVLRARRQEIDAVLQAAVDRLLVLDAPAYFELLLNMVQRLALEGAGVLCLNARDLQRMPAAFGQALRALPEGRQVTLSDVPVAIDGGFVLRYDDIEINASFAALLEEKRALLEDMVSQALA